MRLGVVLGEPYRLRFFSQACLSLKEQCRLADKDRKTKVIFTFRG